MHLKVLPVASGCNRTEELESLDNEDEKWYDYSDVFFHTREIVIVSVNFYCVVLLFIIINIVTSTTPLI